MQNEKSKEVSKYESTYKADYEADWDIHRQYIGNFDAWEAMLIGTVYDSVSKTVDGSKITDSYATTLAKERADKVIREAKLPPPVGLTSVKRHLWTSSGRSGFTPMPTPNGRS
jgi:hypothetical protein